jgi:hypothetical protein
MTEKVEKSFLEGLFGGATGGSSGGFWGDFVTAGLQTTGALVAGLMQADAQEEQLVKQEALERERFEWQKQQAALAQQEAGAALALKKQMAAIEARIAAHNLDKSPEGYTRQADRLMQGATIDQNALNTIIAGYQNWSK